MNVLLIFQAIEGFLDGLFFLSKLITVKYSISHSKGLNISRQLKKNGGFFFKLIMLYGVLDKIFSDILSVHF